ncbi:MAG: hypothetical protein HF314_09745 [Ignavibacteria bacterium]|jgi:UDP-2,3-diacylglucosamine pyrophosphatase LpxH|nr:hypothetical protein [Ignavibacteria bacterium]MCU7503347.1 hypothetical protein [Ignavibacteria bacterium]MCU7515707.1 hypothetical protein [Ignavibacteria bacterium]
MPDSFDEYTAELLLNCEKNKLTENYGNPEVSISSEGKDIYIVSDLHITQLRNNGKNAPPSKKKQDLAFTKFIGYLSRKVMPGRGILVINGDFIDFLRITALPSSEGGLKEWKSILEKIGISKSLESLRASISKREMKYGLSTDDFKSVWKLHVVLKEHSGVFKALIQWLERGNKLVIIKGNHDLEFYWPAVRNYTRLILAEQSLNEDTPAELLKKWVFPNLLFVDDTLVIDKKYHIEHGHKYDRYCHCIGGPLLKNNKQINMPFGSFFNVYLLNHIELAYPPFKNVRLKRNILPLLVEKRFFVGIRKLFQNIPPLFLVIPIRYYRYLFGRVLMIVLTVFLPLLYAMDKFWNIIEPLTLRLDAENENPASGQKLLKMPGQSVLENFGLFIVSFILSRASSYIQLEEPNSLYQHARRKFSENMNYRLVTFGHTHTPEVFSLKDQWFVNTGSWIPTVELFSSEKKKDNACTFMYLCSTGREGGEEGFLQQWDDKKAGTVVITALKKVPSEGLNVGRQEKPNPRKGTQLKLKG